jgi:hypothetical protein
MRLFFTIILLGFCVSSSLKAGILDVPSMDYPTIQTAIDSAMDGDTVLVQPGVYYETINFIGKNITVASLYLTSEDTSHVSQTALNGEYMNPVVTFENGEDSTAMLIGFTLINGYNDPGGGGGINCKNYSNPTLKYLKIVENYAGNGAGIYCFNHANPSLSNVIIYMNEAYSYGGGLFCEKNSSPVLDNVILQSNTSDADGGGIYCTDSSFAKLSNVIIADNRAIYNGGGIYCDINSDLVLDSVTIEQNIGEDFGGGIFCSESNIRLTNVIIRADSASHGGGIFFESSPQASLENVRLTNNRSFTDGGGISLYESQISLKNTLINENQALGSGGGLYLAFSELNFDTENLSSIYLNHAPFAGNDLYSEDGETINVILDTFTVANPSDYQAFPFDSYTFTITNGKVTQVEGDLYVDTQNGSNDHSGLSQNQALKTISYALTKILADTLNPQTIYLEPGVYSPDTNGEIYPLNMKDFVSLKKVEFDTIYTGDTTEVILFAAHERSIMVLNEDKGIKLNRLVLTGGSGDLGGAIYCRKSNPLMTNLSINNNSSSNGGALYAVNSHPIVVNTILWNNAPQEIYLEAINDDSSSIALDHCDIQGGRVNIDTIGTSVIAWFQDNRDADPLFTNPSNFDFSLSYPNSPCIDAGTAVFEWNGKTVVDLYLNTGFSGASPEIGAHEWIDPTGIHEIENLPVFYALYQNYPNPFNPKTKILFALPKPEKVKIQIYNTLGQKVEVLLDRVVKAGSHELIFDGSKYASGIYFYIIQDGDFYQVKRMTLLK